MRLSTLLLDQREWDLVLDSFGNIAKAGPPYALAQDVASAIRLFLGELWYNIGKGVPYWERVLGHLPPVSLLTGYLEKAARTVPGVVTARCNIIEFSNREVRGEVVFIDEEGQQNGVQF